MWIFLTPTSKTDTINHSTTNMKGLPATKYGIKSKPKRLHTHTHTHTHTHSSTPILAYTHTDTHTHTHTHKYARTRTRTRTHTHTHTHTFLYYICFLFNYCENNLKKDSGVYNNHWEINCPPHINRSFWNPTNSLAFLRRTNPLGLEIICQVNRI